ncbi:hypothetical protein [Variovorax beijingensis]|uniref:hypothetical protein n=1 Tax=Variovorax beijingensis TaxID=2496117 RepID=UPI001639BCDE|nr:hypothetical protein [Variovorax beijingensis]
MRFIIDLQALFVDPSRTTRFPKTVHPEMIERIDDNNFGVNECQLAPPRITGLPGCGSRFSSSAE